MESELFNDPNEVALLNVPKPKRPKYKWKGIHVPSKAKPAWLERAKTSHAAILQKYGGDRLGGGMDKEPLSGLAKGEYFTTLTKRVKDE